MSWELDRRPAPSEKGFTLIELMVSLSIIVILMGSVFGVLSVSMNSYAEGDSVAEMEATGRRVLDRISEDLRAGILATMTPPVPAESTTLSINQAADFDAGVVVQGARLGYELRADPADPTNGLDDDHDGMVDEKTVVRTEGATETNIAANVKDLRFTLTGKHVLVNVTIDRVVRGNRSFSTTDSLKVRIRN